VRELARPQARAHILAAAVAVPLTFLVASKYTLGRIEPGYFTRPGAVSQLCVFFLIPLFAVLLCRREVLGRTVVMVAVLAAVMFSSLSPVSTGADALAIAARTVSSRIVPAKERVVHGTDYGLPRIGSLVVTNPAAFDDLVALRDALRQYLRPGETFLDLTNASSLYYYLDLPVPALYSSDYVAANSWMQERMLARLSADPPPVVLAAPAEQFDGGPVGLRSYLLYRYAVLNYAPVQCGKYTLLVRRDRIALTRAPATQVAANAVVDSLKVVSAPDQLYWIPWAWGRSWSDLRPRFDVVAALPDDTMQVRGAQPVAPGSRRYTKPNGVISITCPLPPDFRDGTAADFLHFAFHFAPSHPSARALMQINWEYDDGSTSSPALFYMESGDAVMPLGAYPSWLLSKHLAKLKIECESPSELTQFGITDAQLLRLRPLLK
jgi:hypothetical protein